MSRDARAPLGIARPVIRGASAVFLFRFARFLFFAARRAWEMNFPDDSGVLGGPAVWRRRVASACIRPKTAYCSEVTNRFCKTQTCRLWKINFFKVNLYISSIEVLHNRLKKNASYYRCFAIFLLSFYDLRSWSKFYRVPAYDVHNNFICHLIEHFDKMCQ